MYKAQKLHQQLEPFQNFIHEFICLSLLHNHYKLQIICRCESSIRDLTILNESIVLAGWGLTI